MTVKFRTDAYFAGNVKSHWKGERIRDCVDYTVLDRNQETKTQNKFYDFYQKHKVKFGVLFMWKHVRAHFLWLSI